MPRRRFDEQVFKDVATLLRSMADILEQHPEEVTSLDYTMNTTSVFLRGTPFEREYNVRIQTAPAKDESDD